LPDSSVSIEQDTADITHNLGYNPFFLGFYHIDYDGDDYWFAIPGCPHNITPPFAMGVGYTYTDANTIRLSFGISGLADSIEIPYKYYIFIDPKQDVWA
jgi:hypothetical protein